MSTAVAKPVDTQSSFYQRVVGAHGTMMGESIANSAWRSLERWGIDPASLESVQAPGNNALLFRSGSLAIKVVTELENHGREPLEPNPVILTSLRRAHAGFDMGAASVSVQVFPFLNTQDVTPAHVAALCHELYTKYGLIFRDNNMNNVGLTQEGEPYVIDAGSVIPISALPPREAPFFYPQFSGYSDGKWNQVAVNHSHVWPAEQLNVPQIARASFELTQPQSPADRASAPRTGWKAGV